MQYLQSKEVQSIPSFFTQLLISPLQQDLHDGASDNRQERKRHHKHHCFQIPGTVRGREEKWAVDVPKLADDIDDGSCGRPLLGSLVQRGTGPAEDHGVGREAATDVEEGCHVARGVVQGGRGDDEPDAGHGLGDADVVPSFPPAIAGVGGEESGDGSKKVWWRGQDQGESVVA